MKDIVDLQLVPDYIHVRLVHRNLAHMWFVQSVNHTQQFVTECHQTLPLCEWVATSDYTHSMPKSLMSTVVAY